MTEERFVPLAERYMDMIFRTAYSYMKCRADAEDVTQEVLLRLLHTDREFESEDHLRHWLLRVTINRCKMEFRSPWRRVEALEDYAETLAFERPEYLDLFTAVMSLDRKYRLPVHLYYFEGYSTAETAALLGLPEHTVSTRLRRARMKLKNQLTEDCEHD